MSNTSNKEEVFYYDGFVYNFDREKILFNEKEAADDKKIEFENVMYYFLEEERFELYYINVLRQGIPYKLEKSIFINNILYHFTFSSEEKIQYTNQPNKFKVEIKKNKEYTEKMNLKPMSKMEKNKQYFINKSTHKWSLEKFSFNLNYVIESETFSTINVENKKDIQQLLNIDREIKPIDITNYLLDEVLQKKKKKSFFFKK
jgi:hypothetical protein